MKKSENLVVDLGEMAVTIYKKTGLDMEIVLQVLDAEMEYLKEKGIAE